MDTCLNCGGAIGEPGKAYGYAGKWCHCPVHPSRMYQNPASNPLRVVPMFADPDDLERYLKRQLPAAQ
jgi:hypothetical protein